METPKEYFDEVTRCIAKFQELEQSMKEVLFILERLINLRVKDYTHYDTEPKLKSIQDAAMGRLIKMLAVYTEDKKFLSELNKIEKQRNKIAHQSFLLTREEYEDGDLLQQRTSDLEKMWESADAACYKIFERYEDLDETINRITAEQNAKATGEPPSKPLS